MKNLSLIVVVAIAMLSATVYGDSLTKPINGSYYIAGRTVLDPAPNEAQDTHFRVYLTGTSAKSLYQTMKVKAKPDACLDDGSVSKQVGEMVCTRHKKGQFSCAFAIDVMRQRINHAQVC